MDKVTLYCIDTSKDKQAEVLERSQKRLKVVLVGTTIAITLHRQDTRKPYVGTAAGMEFETFGTADD